MEGEVQGHAERVSEAAAQMGVGVGRMLALGTKIVELGAPPPGFLVQRVWVPVNFLAH